MSMSRCRAHTRESAMEMFKIKENQELDIIHYPRLNSTLKDKGATKRNSQQNQNRDCRSDNILISVKFPEYNEIIHTRS